MSEKHTSFFSFLSFAFELAEFLLKRETRLFSHFRYTVENIFPLREEDEGKKKEKEKKKKEEKLK